MPNKNSVNHQHLIFPFEKFKDRLALIDSDQKISLTYQDIHLFSSVEAKQLPKDRSLLFLFINNSIESIIAYLAAINAGHAVALFDSQMTDVLKQNLITTYQPAGIFDVTKIPKWQFYERKTKLNPQLTLLLSTSGTTGSPKLIRLSSENILSNAKSIIEYLHIDSNERAIASLPFHYSYGLSVLHSHLLVGASIVLTNFSFLQLPFWEAITHYACTSLAAVPYTYQMMDKIGVESILPASLKTLTQAGGKLDSSLVIKYHELIRNRNGNFYSMYGQTEATARISYVPPDLLPQKAGSIGVPIPGGKLKIVQDNQEILEPNVTGEIVYEGKNVMLGYANSNADLARGDDLQGVLHTGDLGYFDEDHIFYITGRLKRISKLYGLRINLDEIEQFLITHSPVAVLGTDECLIIFVEEENPLDEEACVNELTSQYGLHPLTFIIRRIKEIPRTPNKKIDYNRLQELALEE